jgi:hypothetical protein
VVKRLKCLDLLALTRTSVDSIIKGISVAAFRNRLCLLQSAPAAARKVVPVEAGFQFLAFSLSRNCGSWFRVSDFAGGGERWIVKRPRYSGLSFVRSRDDA